MKDSKDRTKGQTNDQVKDLTENQNDIESEDQVEVQIEDRSETSIDTKNDSEIKCNNISEVGRVFDDINSQPNSDNDLVLSKHDEIILKQQLSLPEKHFACKKCAKTYSSQSALNLHKKIHEEAKFSCK